MHSANQARIVFITNLCSHYTIRPFELIAQRYDTEFYFTGGHEAYWEKRNKVSLGNFKGEYISGLKIGQRFKISWRLFPLLWERWDFMIKTIDDRFALPWCFMVAKIRRKPFILWTGLWHQPQTRVHRLFNAFTRFIYRQADAIVVYGTHVRDYLVGLGVDKKKIFVGFHSVDNRNFNGRVSEERKQALRNELGIAGKKVILFVGRLEECKGLDYLAQALAKLPRRDFCMLFIGRGSQKENLEACCNQGGFDYKFLDYIETEKLFEYYAIADIFVLPSVTTIDFKEPWGLVINEAMNQGCAVVTTDAVGAAIGGLVRNRATGLVVPERDSGALETALETLLKDEALLRSLKQSAQKEVVNWSPERTTEGFFQAIDYAKRRW